MATATNTSTKNGGSAREKTFKFMVDQEHFESTEGTLTGAQIKVMAHVDPALQLFLEEPGSGADRQVNDDTAVELRKNGQTRFYTMPVANMGAT